MKRRNTRQAREIGKTLATIVLGAALLSGCVTNDDGSQGRDGATGSGGNN